MMMKTESEVRRLTSLLGSAIKFSDSKQREIEKALGWSSGSLSRLLSGGIELRLNHILGICDVIKFPPARFFHAAYPTADGGSDQAARIQRMLQEMHPVLKLPEDGSPAQPDARPLTEAEIERMVFGAITKFFASLGGPPPDDPPKKK